MILNIIFIRNNIRRYNINDEIPLLTAKLVSYNKPSESYPLTFLPNCFIDNISENKQYFADYVIGNSIRNTLFKFNMKKSVKDRNLCRLKLSKNNFNNMQYLIKQNYYMKFFFDDLPIFGQVGDIVFKPSVFTHFQFDINYNDYQIYSINLLMLNSTEISEDASLDFSYSVNWQLTNADVTERSVILKDDNYFKHFTRKYNLINSFLLTIILVFMASLLYYTISKSIRQDNLINIDSNIDEEPLISSVWRSLHGDIFRAPKNSKFLSIISGSGIHISIFLIVYTLINVLLNLYEVRTSAVNYAIIVFMLTSTFASFFGSSFYKIYFNQQWFEVGIYSSLFSSFIIIGVEFFVKIISVLFRIKGTIPILKFVFFLIFSFMTISLLGGVGCVTSKKIALFPENQYQVSLIPKQIRMDALNKAVIMHCLVVGFIISANVLVEIYFVITSAYGLKLFYIFSYTLLCILMMLIHSGCLSIVSIYLLLQKGIYLWQWPSFLVPATSGLYVFIFCIFQYYWSFNMHGFYQLVSYMAHCFILSTFIALSCGSVGYLVGNMFVISIYTNLKLE